MTSTTRASSPAPRRTLQEGRAPHRRDRAEPHRLRLLQPDDAGAQRRAARRGRLLAAPRPTGGHVPPDAAHRVRCAAGARRCINSHAMRAATVRDGEIVVEEHPDPEPGAGELLVRVRAAGLNGADMLQRRGVYPAPPGAPQDVPGLELAGEVAALGPGADRFSEGDRVMAIVGGGGQAELATVHERATMPVPEPL